MEVYIGTIQLFGFDYPPRGWEVCAGQILSISQNEVLFAVIGTYYGGDGQSTFALPDLRDATPCGLKPMNWCICVQGTFPMRH